MINFKKTCYHIKETDETACVAWLMKLYQEKVNEPK